MTRHDEEIAVGLEEHDAELAETGSVPPPVDPEDHAADAIVWRRRSLRWLAEATGFTDPSDERGLATWLMAAIDEETTDGRSTEEALRRSLPGSAEGIASALEDLAALIRDLGPDDGPAPTTSRAS